MNRPSVLVVFRTQSRGKSPVKYEIFDFYSKIANILGESEWVEKFQLLSKGISYNGVKFDGRSLSVKKGSKTKTLEIDIEINMNIEESTEEDFERYEECKKYLSSTMESLITEEDQEIESIIDDENEEDEEFENKFKIGVKNQTIFIKEFAARKCRQFSLSDEVYKCIVSTISSLFISKRLTSKSVYLNKSNGTINRIDGIEINSSGIFVDEESLKIPKVSKIQKKEKKNFIFPSSLMLSKIESKKNNYQNEP